MEISSWPLRIALVVSGVVVMAGVYLWSAWRRRRETNLRHARPRRHGWPPRRGEFEADEDFSQEVGFEARPAAADDYDIVLVKPVSKLTDLPAVTRELEPPSAPPQLPPAPLPAAVPGAMKVTRSGRRGANQLAFGFDDEAGPAPVAKAPTDVLALYLRPPEGADFSGPVLETALAAVGMRFGDMNIYHYHGTGELRAEEPVFSLANMFEPGQFDPLQMQDFTTQGLALFIRFPTPPLDGPVAFELFLNVAQRLAESLGAELLSEPQKALDSPVIERMRRIAARHAR
ncbi:MAG: hypothetical protein EXR83_14025 [Gammaproteobacteria bacterium]|nr:hypothetical protein [Gammaproteobacteria bacterium]